MYAYTNIHVYICLQVYIYTYICVYIKVYVYVNMYVYIYIHISATALCAFGVTRLSNLLSDFCYPILSAFLFNRPPLDQDGRNFQISSGPWAAFENNVFATMPY